MPGGEKRFRKLYPVCAKKIDTDPHIESSLREKFWLEVDKGPEDDDDELRRRVVALCGLNQWQGPLPSPPFEPNEQLGSAQSRKALVNDLSSQHDPRDPLPPLTPNEARLALARIVNETDTRRANREFHRIFGELYVRAMTYGPGTRIFCFRNPDQRTDPVAAIDLKKLFKRLAIPKARDHEYLFFSFEASKASKCHTPTCFDANLHNLDAFMPGGLTAPRRPLLGLPEVVAAPPKCKDVSHPPRKIA